MGSLLLMFGDMGVGVNISVSNEIVTNDGFTITTNDGFTILYEG